MSAPEVGKSKQTRAGAKMRNARPAYQPDNGPLTRKQLAALRRMVPLGKMKATSSLL